MTTMSRMFLTLLFAAAIALGSAACSNGGAGNKCEQTAEKLFTLMEDQFGEQMAEMSDEDKAEVETQKQGLITECKEALAEKPEETNEALDCILAAEALEDTQDCPQLPGT